MTCSSAASPLSASTSGLAASGSSAGKSSEPSQKKQQQPPGSGTSGFIHNRNRSASLFVPPVIGRKTSASCTGSPGSKSLHLSPLAHHQNNPRKSQTLFTFPDPGSLSVTSAASSAASGATNNTSADSGLSSILHVHERYLSSEDFHEALFFERSPKSGQRKRSRKGSASSGGHPAHGSGKMPLESKKLSVTKL